MKPRVVANTRTPASNARLASAIAVPVSSKWMLLAFCLLAPIAAGFIRKLMPGQPSFIRVAGVGAVSLALLLSLSRSRTPTWVRMPLTVWVVLCVGYLVPTFLHSVSMGLATATLYILPLSLGGIAYATLRSEDSVVSLAKVFGWLAVALLPFALVVTIADDSALVWFLRASEAATDLNLNESKGLFSAPSLLLSTPTELAYSMLPGVFLLLSAIEIKRLKGETTRGLWLMAVVAGIIVYLCSCRSLIVTALVGFVVVLARGRRQVVRRLLFGALSLVVVIIAINQMTTVDQRVLEQRSGIFSQFDLTERIMVVFLGTTARWLEIGPFGHFLGYSGPLSASFNIDLEYHVVEVGAASLMADVGLFGLAVFLIVAGWLMINLWREAKSSIFRPVMVPLLIFMVFTCGLFLVKAAWILTGASPTHFLFWAIPGIIAALRRRESASVRQRDKAFGELTKPTPD